MSDERIAKLEKSLGSLRKQVSQLSVDQRDTRLTIATAVLASVLSGGIVALTAATWRSAEDTERDRTHVDTLWGMVPDGWLAAVTLGLLVVLTTGTLGIFLTDVDRPRTYYVFMVVALLAAVAVLFVGSVEPSGSLEAEDYDTAPGRWLTLLGCLALASVHGGRANHLK